MNIPETIWSAPLKNGTTLKERVKGKAPHLLPVQDKQAFLNVWNVRLKEAQLRKDKAAEKDIESLLLFLQKHSQEELSSLIWVEEKTTAVLANDTGAVFILQ